MGWVKIVLISISISSDYGCCSVWQIYLFIFSSRMSTRRYVLMILKKSYMSEVISEICCGLEVSIAPPPCLHDWNDHETWNVWHVTLTMKMLLMYSYYIAVWLQAYRLCWTPLLKPWFLYCTLLCLCSSLSSSMPSLAWSSSLGRCMPPVTWMAHVSVPLGGHVCVLPYRIFLLLFCCLSYSLWSLARMYCMLILISANASWTCWFMEIRVLNNAPWV